MGSSLTRRQHTATTAAQSHPSLSKSLSIHLQPADTMGPVGHYVAPGVSSISLNCSNKRDVAPL